MRVTECIITVPGDSVYDVIGRKEAINKYNRMSGPDFKSQFTTSEEIFFEESEIAVTGGPLKNKRIIRKVAPFTKIDTWHKKRVNASIGSLIYTELDGFPIGEYVAVSDASHSGVANDIYNFYRIYGWDANVLFCTDRLMPEVKDGPQPLLEVEKHVVSEMSKMIGH